MKEGGRGVMEGGRGVKEGGRGVKEGGRGVFVIIFCIAVLLVFLIVPNRRMWAQPAPSIQRHEIRNCVNICLKVNCDSNELKECNKKENVCVCSIL